MPKATRVLGMPEIVMWECPGCGTTEVAHDDLLERYCLVCRKDPLPVEGLDPWKGRTGGSEPNA